MLDPIKTPTCVIHTMTPRSTVVSKNVANHHLVQSKETRLVVFLGSILLISHLITLPPGNSNKRVIKSHYAHLFYSQSSQSFINFIDVFYFPHDVHVNDSECIPCIPTKVKLTIFPLHLIFNIIILSPIYTNSSYIYVFRLYFLS